jgi:hypothetical protein
LGRHSLEKSAFMLCYIHIFDSDLSVIPLSWLTYLTFTVRDSNLESCEECGKSEPLNGG